MQKVLHHIVHSIIAKIVVTGVCLMVFAAGTAAALHTQLPLELGYTRTNHAIDQEMAIDFGQSLASVGKPVINPYAEGEWVYYQGPMGVRGVGFRPTKPLLVSQDYVISFTGARRVVTGDVSIPDVTFRTEDAPELESFSIQDGDMVAADHVFTATLSHKNRGLRTLELTTDPEMKTAYVTSDNVTYTWESTELLPQGKNMKVTLKDTQNDMVLGEYAVTVASQPIVASYAKEHDVVPGDVLTIVFKQAIDRSKLPEDALVFDAPGSGDWQNDTTYRFTPADIVPGRTYEYVIAKGLRTKQGGVLEKSIKKSFSTRGQVYLAGVSPTGSSVAQGTQDIRLSFSQPVDKASVEQRVRVSAGKMESSHWQGSTYVIKMTSLGYQKTVHVSVAAGVKPTGFGLANSSGLGFSFTTEARQRRLAVPYYRQVYAQSCEAASLRMALAYRSTQATDWNILQKFGYAPTTKDKKKNVWGDPQKGFVGDVNGNQGAGTGWGVYAEPVAAAARSYGRQATVRYGVSAQFLAEQIYAGNPVVLWGIWGNSAAIQTWKTPEGKTVSGPFPMHVRLVVGVVGEPSNPLGFYVHDPITGTAYWSAGQLIGNTQKAGAANQAVVVH